MGRMRRFLILLSCLMVTFAAQHSPVLAASRNYPMQVQVFHVHWHGRRGWSQGFGRADLFSKEPGVPPEQGMDFEFSCGQPVRDSMGPDMYPARYGKNRLEIVVGLPEMGSDKVHECTLKVEMKDYVYVRNGHGGLYEAPLNGGPQSPVQDDDQQ
jgi:hypothetical protein